MNYDIIGDIHGHADRLEAILTALGYSHRNGAWRHSDRSAIFVGDFIDRGPGQLRTLTMVRGMIDAGSAKAIMGNHEFNAIAWATPNRANIGLHLRPRHGEKGKKNRRQHEAFLSEVNEDSATHAEWIQWFYELPLWIQERDFQVVHACWSPTHMEMLSPQLKSNNRLTQEVVEAASEKGTPPYEAIETILKGVEVKLPAGHIFTDKEGDVRHEIRTQWWNPDLATYRAAYIGPPGADIPDMPLAEYPKIQMPDRPTFIGHYWLSGVMAPLSKRVACVDYSVARGGPLVAYRFDGERELSKAKFIAV